MPSRIFILFLFFFWSQQTYAASQITKVRAWKSPDKTRVVFEITNKANYSVFQLHKPERLVIDLKNTSINSLALKKLDYNGLIVNSRSSKRGKNSLRLVLQLKNKVRIKDFQLKPNLNYRHRLVVDLFETSVKQKKSPIKSVKKSPAPSKTAAIKTTKRKTKKSIKKSAASIGHRDIVVAIDAGHGGEDPGAIGRRGTLLKKI